ncbi:MAG: cyanase [Solirubrobacteraceae bacterium]
MTRAELTEQILAAKRRQGLTFAEIALPLGRDRTWTAAALLGQHPFAADEAAEVTKLLDLPPDATLLLQEIPMRGSLEHAVPTDPTIYRLYEVLQVYGTTIKALIHEEFGDGIMSAIAFNLDVAREPHEDGDRVRITLDGKFLPYKW